MKTILNIAIGILLGIFFTISIVMKWGFVQKIEVPVHRHTTYTPFDEKHCNFSSFRREVDLPCRQYEVYFYGNEVEDGVWQFALFDKPGIGAKLIGVEYLISDAVYQKIPPAWRGYLHPLDYDAAALMVGDEVQIKKFGKMWGTSYRLWKPDDEKIPSTTPKKLWPFTEPGKLYPVLLKDRDARLEVNTAEIVKNRGKK